jgi:putative SOS response-associated peptidase YedK
MCGRYQLTSPIEAIRAQGGGNIGRRFNIAPSMIAGVVRRGEDGREIVPMKWGLLPAWADPEKIMTTPINAKAEGVASTAFFRSAFKSRRCIVPATGFYEWEKTELKNIPHLFTVDGGSPFAFAGLWGRWQRGGAEPVETFTIITTQPNELVARCHDRMPVILDASEIDGWLSETDPAKAYALLDPFPTERMTDRAVSTKTNSSKYEGRSTDRLAMSFFVSKYREEPRPWSVRSFHARCARLGHDGPRTATASNHRQSCSHELRSVRRVDNERKVARTLKRQRLYRTP